MAIEQVYLGENPAAEKISWSLSALQSEPAADPTGLGERTLLPAQLGLSQPDVIDAVFGTGFFERLEKILPGTWSGPVASGYGAHLVRIVKTTPATTPQLEDVREAVLRDWKAAKAQEIRELRYAQLRERYVIEIPDTDAASDGNR
jgi:hypothetical protein